MKEAPIKLGYVIGPFDAPTAWELAENIHLAERVGFHIAMLGAMPVVPHAITHNFHNLMTSAFWYRGTLELLKRCDFAVTTEIVGGSIEKSKGSRDEVDWLLRCQTERPLFRDLPGLTAYLQQAILL